MDIYNYFYSFILYQKIGDFKEIFLLSLKNGDKVVEKCKRLIMNTKLIASNWLRH